MRAGMNPAGRRLDEREQLVEVARHVDDPDRLRVEAELGPRDRLHQLVQGPEAAGQHDEPVRELVHQRLALVQRLDNVELGEAAVRDLALLQEARNDPDHASPRRERRVGDDAHQADLAAAGDELDRPRRERTPELGRSSRVAGIVPRGSTTEDADATHAPSLETAPPLAELFDPHGPADAALRVHVDPVGAGAAEGRDLVRADGVERDAARSGAFP